MSTNILIKKTALLLAFCFCIAITGFGQSETHTVQKGETLFSIAEQYNLEVTQLREWNNLQGNQISVGQQLVVSRSNNTQTGDAENAVTHTVEPQETLFSISKQYNVNIAEVKEWNDLTSNNLKVGQELTIYPSEESGGQQSIVVDKETQQNTYYVVKSGDSLYEIAQQHGMTVSELKSLNGLKTNTIRIGQRLTVRGNSAPPSVAESAESSPQGKFITYEVGSTMSLQDVLEKFNMHEQEFRALNPTIDDTRFQSGRKLTVLAPPSKSYENPYLTDTNMQDLGTTSVSKYSASDRAKTTTSGELYNPEALTAAHSNISLGTVVFIENPENQKGIYVRINDRSSGNGLKLSSAAWEILNFKSTSPKVTIYQNQ